MYIPKSAKSNINIYGLLQANIKTFSIIKVVRPQNIPLHREDETQETNSHNDSKNEIKQNIPLWESVIFLYFVVRYFMFILVWQSS